MSTKKNKREHTDAEKELRNEDPLSGQAGAHPVGTGVGAAIGGAAAGAAAGTVAGPIGTIVGTIVGGVAGGLAGKSVAESYDPTVEVDYWRNEYTNRPYYDKSRSFEHVEPAYRAGIDAYDPTTTATFDEREAIAREQWEKYDDDTLTWEDARPAAEDAYTRLAKRRPK
jgi:phage tail tape-measure protein